MDAHPHTVASACLAACEAVLGVMPIADMDRARACIANKRAWLGGESVCDEDVWMQGGDAPEERDDCIELAVTEACQLSELLEHDVEFIFDMLWEAVAWPSRHYDETVE